MSNRINEMDWLFEAELPASAGAPDVGGGQPPMSQPGGPGDPMGAAPPNIPQQGGPDPSQAPEDISADPQHPEMPEEDDDDKSFEQWKMAFIKESIKGDPNVLVDMILKIRDKELDPGPEKFVEDNIQINFLRQHQDILVPSKEIRNLIKKQLDRNSPGTSLVSYIVETLEKYILVTQMFIRLRGAGEYKQGLHRKLIAALLGAVQVGSGASQEDLVFEESDYSIRVSTRFNAKWGDVNIGRWMLTENDPEKYLKQAELQRLESGSPEEKDVLRRRIVMESIADMFKTRAFIINVVGRDGTVQHLGLDLGNCLKAAYTDGKLVVRSHNSDLQEAFIDEEGSIVAVPNLSIYYVKDANSIDEKGNAETEELEFIQHRDGCLYLTAQGDLIKEATSTLQGLVFKETPWQGNPTDLLKLIRCVPSVSEYFYRSC